MQLRLHTQLILNTLLDDNSKIGYLIRARESTVKTGLKRAYKWFQMDFQAVENYACYYFSNYRKHADAPPVDAVPELQSLSILVGDNICGKNALSLL